MTGKRMVELFLQNGWILSRIHGSHHILKKDGNVEVIPVHYGRDLPKGLEQKLRKRIDM